MTVRDLRREPPRRWNETIDGVRWVPRLIDKARAAQAGTLGTYLFGQSPIDRAMLHSAGCGHRVFAEIVAAEPTDEGILRALVAQKPESETSLRRWSDALPRRHRLFMFVLDVDDGYLQGGWRALKGPANVASDAVTWVVKRVWPVNYANDSAP